MTVLDISNLEKATLSLTMAIKSYQKRLTEGADEWELATLTAGVIQNFEFAHELSWKTMKKFLAFNLSPNRVEDITKRQLFIMAVDQGLITNENQWLDFNLARNSTSHNYSQVVANQVLESAIAFAKEAQMLLDTLHKKNDSN